MEPTVNALWHTLLPLLNTFTQRIAGSDPRIMCNIGHFTTEASLLFAYAAMFKSAQGEVVEVTLDVSRHDGVLILSADAATDDGEILAHGPRTQVQPGTRLSLSEGPLAQWVSRFRRFLQSVEPTVRQSIAEL